MLSAVGMSLKKSKVSDTANATNPYSLGTTPMSDLLSSATIPRKGWK
jgi:hypothetical protein